MKEKIPMTAGILAGGKSSRMGENKAFLTWKDTTFLEHALACMEGFLECLVSVDNKEHFKKIGAPLVEDVQKDYGPLEGLYQLLKEASYDWIFLTAVDMPLLNQELIDKIVTVDNGGVKAVVLKTNEQIHPMCGLYHVSVLPVIEQLFLEQRHSMMGLLERIPVRYVEVESLGIQGRQLVNVNTPEEYTTLTAENNNGK